MTTACHGGAGGTPRTSFSNTLFPEPGLEVGKARPSANSLEEIASPAALDGSDAGEMGSPAHSVASPGVAVGDGRIKAGSLSRPCLSWPGSHSALAVQVVKIKEEEVEKEEAAMVADPGDATTMSPSCSWGAAAEEVVRPMEGLGEVGPTPFLRKTYEMVSDPGSDPVVSWSSGRDSFVVWDQHEFSKQVLPRYFKHSNFSSFIRQLNTYVECDPLGASSYSSPSQQIVPGAKRLGSKGFHSRRFAQGFRKIDMERWEFASEGFQAGKKHLLKNIKRRGKFSKHRKISSSSFTSGHQKAGKEAVLETLKKDQEALKAEILKLREEQENSQHEIDQVTEQVRCAECRHQQMFLFLYKAAKSPNFVQQLIQKRRHKRELDIRESSKKSKLLDPDGATQCLLEAMDPKIQSPKVDCLTISDESAQMESQPNSVVLEDFETIQMHNPWPSPLGGRDFRVVQGQTPDQMAGASPSHLSSVFHEMSERLLEDNMVVGDNVADVEEVEDLVVNDSRIYLELEGLIEKPCGWSDYPSGPMEQAAGVMP